MKFFKKYLALLLAILITVLSLPLTALAEGSTPEVKSVEIEKISIIEGTKGYKQTAYNPDTGNYDLEYYHYSYTPKFTVTLKDNTVLESQGDCVTYNEKDYYLFRFDDQSYNNQWGVGTHTVNASIMGFDTSFDVEITETPVANVQFENISIIEGTNGYKQTDYNPDTGNYDLEYYHYSYPPKFTVTLKDNTVLESQGNCVIYNETSYYLSYSDGQSYNNQWGVGTHTVNASIMGFDTSFEVEITENPVENVQVENISIIEGTNRYKQPAYNPDTGNWDLEYYYYNYTPKFTVTLKDNTVLESQWGRVTYNETNYSLSYSDGQSYNNQWGVGTHTVNASIMGFDTTFEVEITEIPVAKIEFEKISFTEGTNRYKRTEYNPDTGKWDLEYYCYGYTPKFTVTLKDNTVLESQGGWVTYNETSYYLSYSDGQSYNNQWGVGTHTVNASIMGFDTTFEVEITENPVAKIEFEKISFTEGTNRSKRTEYNPDTGNYDLEYYRYNYTPKFTVTLKDNTVLESQWGWVTYNETNYSLSYWDDQSYNNQWGVGTHTVNASIMGFDTSFEVEITESPYVSLEILDVYPLKENENCYVNANGDIIYHKPVVIFKVTDKDGKSFIASTLNEYYASFSDNQYEQPWTVGGDNRFTIHYLNLSAEGSVELEASSPFEYIEQNGGLYITGYTVPGQESLEIPSEIGGKPVIGVLSLGEYNVVSSLTSVTIPDSVTTIGDSAFLCAYSLETITIGSGVNYLNADMFSNLKSLYSISVSKDNPYYCDEDGIVYNKQKTALVVYPLAKGEDYIVPASVTDIDILNKSMYNFVNVTFADGSKMFVTVDGVTYNADKTRVITCDKAKTGYYDMPDTVTEIAENAFSGCSQLTGVKVSENVTSIVYMAFENCGSLSEITLPSKLVSIEEWAFSGCSQLEEVSIPDTLDSVGGGAFYDCSSLSKVNISDIAKWCNIDFAYYTSNPLYYAHDLYMNGNKLTNIEIPNGVTSINNYAFYNCSLLSLTIPGSVKSIGNDAFYRCSNITSVTMLNGVKSIGDSAFFGCSSLEALTIPDSVTYLGSSAFDECNSLASVSIGNGLTEISNFAFSNSGLNKLTIPKNITKIDDGAFYNCKNLTDVVFTNSNIEIGDYAFSGCPIKELNLPEGIKNSGGTASFAGTDISKLSLPNSVTRIAYENFANCSNLTEIDIPESVISMGGHAFDRTPWYYAQADGEVYLEHVFYDYKGEMPVNTEINIKDGTTVIADYALEERAGLTKLTFPEGLKAIGCWALYNCASIKEINIPASVTDIDTSAFAGCSSLTAINVAGGNSKYKSIDGVLFSKDGTKLLWCPKRERYEVPESVTSIATGAFSDSGVTSVKIMNPNTELCEYSVGFRSTGHDWSDYFSQSFGWSGGKFEYNVVEIICSENSKAYAYAKQNFMLATVPEEIEIETADKGVNISGTTDIISENTVINVEQKTTDEILITDTDTERYNLETAVVFDISLEKDGVKVQPNGKLTVSIAVPENLNGAKCRVLYVDENGKTTNMKAIYRDGLMIFETDHFSNYMIVEMNYIIGDVNGDSRINNKDLGLLMQKLNGWSVEISDTVADVNADGKVNNKDYGLLMQYVNGWKVEIV